MIFKLNKKSKKKYFYNILLSSFSIGLITILILMRIDGDKNLESNLLVLLAFFLSWCIIFALPVLLLYDNHKRNSIGVTLKKNDNLYIYTKEGKSIEFEIKDIKKIELWLTPPAYDKRTDWLFFGKYHFIKFFLNTDQVVNVSCLVFSELEVFFPGNLIIRKKKMFPFIK